MPNVVRIDPYYLELYCFKVGAFFETQFIKILRSNERKLQLLYIMNTSEVHFVNG